MAGESRHERPVRRGRIDDGGGDGEEGEKLYYHLTLLAETTAGYRNLIKLSSAAYLEGYYYKPRVDWELLERHHEGVIATTGCLGGRRAPGPAARRRRGARPGWPAGSRTSSAGTTCSSSSRTTGSPSSAKTNPQLLDIARRIGAPLLATNDSHYTHREDAVAHDALLCVQTGSPMDDPDAVQVRGRRALPEVGGRDAPPLRRGARGVRQHAVDRRAGRRRDRVRQAASCPSFPRPDGLRRRRRLPPPPDLSRAPSSATATPLPDKVVERLDYELGVISEHGLLRLLPRRLGPDPLRPGRGASGSARAGAARPAAAWPTACGSSTSTRSATTCCSSASSTRAASRCPTSTWTSTSATGAR